MQFYGEVSIVIYNKVNRVSETLKISRRESLLKPAHGFAVTMITILPVVCAAYEKTAEAARSEFYMDAIGWLDRNVSLCKSSDL